MTKCAILAVGSRTDDEPFIGDRMRIVDVLPMSDEALEQALSIEAERRSLSHLRLSFQLQQRLTPAEWTGLEDAVVDAARAFLDGLGARCRWPHYECDGKSIHNGLCDEHLRIAGE